MQGLTRVGVRTLLIAIVALSALCAVAEGALARTIPIYTHTGEFYDGSGSTAGPLAYGVDVELNQQTGHGYIFDPARFENSFSQFDRDGNPAAFQALNGATSVSIGGEGGIRMAVDNSGTASNGNIYLMNGRGVISGFKSDGTKLPAPFPFGGFQSACGLAVDSTGHIWVADGRAGTMFEFTAFGAPTGRKFAIPKEFDSYHCDIAIDSNDDLYLTAKGHIEFTTKYNLNGEVLSQLNGGLTLAMTVDRSTDHVLTLESRDFSTGEIVEYDENGDPVTVFGGADPGKSFPGLINPQGIAIDESTKRVYVTNERDYSGRQHVEIFARAGQAVVPTVLTEAPTLAPTTVTLNGRVDLDGGGDTTACYFEWGTTAGYGQVEPCTPPLVTGSGAKAVSASLSGLTQGTKYHYRLVAKNSNGILAFGRDRGFRPEGPASVSGTLLSEVNTDGARVSAEVDPNGGDTSYWVEYGAEACDLGGCASAPLGKATLPNALGVQTASVVLTGLTPDTPYHYRLIASNDFGETIGDEDVLRTYPVESTADDCANAVVRKELSAVRLPDCRAYELVSAGRAGGYDVRSDLLPGQVPLEAKPRATDKLLYSLNFGKIPGISGEPTNLELDPYVATRTAEGWSTSYAGIPVGLPPYQPPFGSRPLAESEDLSTLVFGGSGICDPCFSDGSTGLPVRRNGGPLSQGMTGSLDPGGNAVDEGFVGRRLSAGGTHLVFASTSVFEPDAPGGGELSVYNRDLLNGTTRVVSSTPLGSALPCLQGPGNCHGPANPDGIASLDVSDDGSRVIVANRVSTDPAGNRLWHPYISIAGSSSTVDLAPGTTSGVLYSGMSGDGSTVIYASADPLTPDDHDTSIDIFRATVSASGTLALTRVSTGAGEGDTDACTPIPGLSGCDATVAGGAAGVARGNGAVYFLSPEKLVSGAGVAGEPNLYSSTPASSPSFVATLDSSDDPVLAATDPGDASTFGSFQVTPDGRFAAFASSREVTDFRTLGHSAIYRFSTQAQALECASCPATRASLVSDTRLSRHGLNLADDGRVFFTSDEPLTLQDSGDTADVYEWKAGRIWLLSTGRSQTDSGLLSASADGVDAFFYTRETLASDDHNGTTMKIYDAREGGGFRTPLALKECQASDECHGPGSLAPESASLPTFHGVGGNQKSKAKSKRKHKKKKHKKKKHNKKGGRSR